MRRLLFVRVIIEREFNAGSRLHGVSLDGRRMVACWLCVCALISLTILIVRLSEVLEHPDGARAALIPATVALAELVGAARLVHAPSGSRFFASLTLLVQLFAFSGGPIAYRLIAGPYLMLGTTNARSIHAWWGIDAHFLSVLGPSNRVPSAFALNVSALLALAVLFAGHANDDRERLSPTSAIQSDQSD